MDTEDDDNDDDDDDQVGEQNNKFHIDCSYARGRCTETNSMDEPPNKVQQLMINQTEPKPSNSCHSDHEK